MKSNLDSIMTFRGPVHLIFWLLTLLPPFIVNCEKNPVDMDSTGAHYNHQRNDIRYLNKIVADTGSILWGLNSYALYAMKLDRDNRTIVLATDSLYYISRISSNNKGIVLLQVSEHLCRLTLKNNHIKYDTLLKYPQYSFSSDMQYDSSGTYWFLDKRYKNTSLCSYSNGQYTTIPIDSSYHDNTLFYVGDISKGIIFHNMYYNDTIECLLIDLNNEVSRNKYCLPYNKLRLIDFFLIDTTFYLQCEVNTQGLDVYLDSSLIGDDDKQITDGGVLIKVANGKLIKVMNRNELNSWFDMYRTKDNHTKLTNASNIISISSSDITLYGIDPNLSSTFLTLNSNLHCYYAPSSKLINVEALSLLIVDRIELPSVINQKRSPLLKFK